MITPIVEGSIVNEPSDSSASATIHSPFPSFALAFIPLIIPPLIIVGSYPEYSSIDEISEVVVVLPCEPETVIDFFNSSLLQASLLLSIRNIFRAPELILHYLL